MMLTDANGALLPEVPLFIVAAATEEDWRQYVRTCGGPDDPHVPPDSHFYFVSTD